MFTLEGIENIESGGADVPAVGMDVEVRVDGIAYDCSVTAVRMVVESYYDATGLADSWYVVSLERKAWQ